MNYQELTEELCDLHFRYAPAVNKLDSFRFFRGEDGALIWLYKRNASACASDLVEAFGLTPGRVANIVRKLEQQSYITRAQDCSDQRRSHIYLTPSGAETAKRKYSEMLSCFQSILDQLCEEDAAAYVHIFGLLMRSASTPDSPGKE